MRVSWRRSVAHLPLSESSIPLKPLHQSMHPSDANQESRIPGHTVEEIVALIVAKSIFLRSDSAADFMPGAGSLMGKAVLGRASCLRFRLHPNSPLGRPDFR